MSGSIRPITSRAVVDLPQPDSPTMPSTSPLSTVKLTSSTARTTPPRPNRPPPTGKCLLRRAHLEQRLLRAADVGDRRERRQARTSIALRMPSLSRLKQIDTMKIITPGSAATHGLT